MHHPVCQSSFVVLFSENVYVQDASGYIMEPCGYLTRRNSQPNANTPKKFTKPGEKNPMNGCTTGDVGSGSFRELPDPEQP
jgi:hypothetical protein